jgi:hypothetical protein
VNAITITASRSPLIERVLRAAIGDAKLKAKILEVTGWDESMPSKVINGQAGILLKHFDAICKVLDLAVAEVAYMNYLAQGNQIGSNCACARASMGACGQQ